MKTEYDVVVLGAGPAISMAARTAAQACLSTLLLEKRQEIGSPVRCAEAVEKETLARFVALDPRWIAAEIRTFYVSNSEGNCGVMPPLEETLVLVRKLFDRELAHLAAQAGAEVAVMARADGFSREDNEHLVVHILLKGEPICIRSLIVIGADGTGSQSTRWAGLHVVPLLKDYFVAAQYLVSGIEIDPHICRYYFGWDVAPSGYAWVFQKGDRKANIGLVITEQPEERRPVLYYLDAFMLVHFPTSSILVQVVGGIPVTNVLPHMVADNYLAVGDAARQSDPLTAGGITNGMFGGLYAAQVAGAAILAGDLSAKFLKQDESLWNAAFGKLLHRLYRIQYTIYRIPDAGIRQMIKQASVLDAGKMSLKDVLAILFMVQPQLLAEVMPFFWNNE